MNYTTLSLAEVRAGLEAAAREAQETFGGLDRRQLNWRPDATRWSVAQCLDHLLVVNRLLLQAAGDALDETRPRTFWQRLPVLPGVFGRLLIRSQAPEAARKFTAPPNARPSASDLGADLIPRLVEQHGTIASWMQALDEDRAARAIMTSPFLRVVTYSVADGLRLMLAHDRRHLAQARRVTLSHGFPAAAAT